MQDTFIVGSGGKGSGAGGGLTESPDSLSSVAIAKFVDLVGEGPIEGLVNGEYSIYLDGVPLRDVSGTPNYKPFTWRSTLGTQSQAPLEGFIGSSQSNAVGLQLPLSLGKVIRVIPDLDADAVEVTVAAAGLSSTSSDGRVLSTNVEYRVSARKQGTAWSLVFNAWLEGKTNARYQRTHKISLSTLGTGPFEVAVERISPDSTSALLVNAISWDSFNVINHEKLAYPNSALVGVELDARHFNSVPARSYHVRGLLVRVPSNYNPETRVYTGTWNGTWIVRYTNNPVWCYMDMLTNTRYGLGHRVTLDMVDKWALYTLAKYCDEPVATGMSVTAYETVEIPSWSGESMLTSVPVRYGDTEPRFTLNVVLNQQEDAYKLLGQLTSVFRGMAYWSGGMVTLSQDSPAEPSIIWNNANVIGGVFTYEGSAKSQRHTTVTVGWNDPTENFKQKFEYIEDREGITRYGVRHSDIVAFGCTSRSQARRAGLWLLYTERMEKDAVRFTAGLDSAMVVPGMIGMVVDNNRLGARWGGRVISATTLSVVLDAPVSLQMGNYTFSSMTKAGTVIKRTVNIPSDTLTNSLAWSIPMPEAPEPMSMWVLGSAVVTPMLVRVVGIKPTTAATFEITALEHVPSKYAAIEEGAPLEVPNYSALSYGVVPPITGLRAEDHTYKSPDTGRTTVSISISWNLLKDPTVKAYRIRLTNDSGDIIDLPEQTRSAITVNELVPDFYTVAVRAVNALGLTGPWSEATVGVSGISSKPAPPVTGLAATYAAGFINVKWTAVADLSYGGTEVQLASWVPGATTLFRGSADSFSWKSPGAGTYTFYVKHFDTTGNYSQSASTTQITVTADQVAATAQPVLTLSRYQVPVTTNAQGLVNSASPEVTARVTLEGVDVTSDWTLGVSYGSGVTVTYPGTGGVFSIHSLTVTLATATISAVPMTGTFNMLSQTFTITKPAPLPVGFPDSVVNGSWNALGEGPGYVEASIQFRSDGTVYTTDGTFMAYDGGWYTNASPGIGGSYWIKMTKVFGPAPTGGVWGTLLNTWQSLADDREWYIAAINEASYTNTYTYSISPNATGVPVVGTGTIMLTASSWS